MDGLTGMHATHNNCRNSDFITIGSYDHFQRTLTLTANMAQGAAAFACAVKTKIEILRILTLICQFTAFFAGVQEPCIYGVSIRLKKPITLQLWLEEVYLEDYMLVLWFKTLLSTPSIDNLPMWVRDNPNNLMNAIITMIISAVVTFITTLVVVLMIEERKWVKRW